jgi:hypothetical protein
VSWSGVGLDEGELHLRLRECMGKTLGTPPWVEKHETCTDMVNATSLAGSDCFHHRDGHML